MKKTFFDTKYGKLTDSRRDVGTVYMPIGNSLVAVPWEHMQ